MRNGTHKLFWVDDEKEKDIRGLLSSIVAYDGIRLPIHKALKLNVVQATSKQ